MSELRDKSEEKGAGSHDIINHRRLEEKYRLTWTQCVSRWQARGAAAMGYVGSVGQV